MRSKRKKARADQGRHGKKEERVFAHRPFEELLQDSWNIERDKELLPVQSIPVSTPEETEEYLFEKAMEGVVPVRGKRKIIRSPVNKHKELDDVPPLGIKERDYLLSLVRESEAWDISFSDEYIEGAVSGVSPKIMRRLKRGEFSIQDYIDLHGLTKKEAEPAVTDFLTQSYQRDLRCVLIVHGRGLGSADQHPAIKTELPVWLRRGALKKIVLAFATAQPYDGGAGAVYVLLRKR